MDDRHSGLRISQKRAGNPTGGGPPRRGQRSGWRLGYVAFRLWWHGKMSWPVSLQGYSYQVCLGGGTVRLFNGKKFSA
jgi:hypothetical protein